jgi:hypothetical protein
MAWRSRSSPSFEGRLYSENTRLSSNGQLPNPKLDQDSFVARLEELAAKVGGKSALANLADIPATTLQNYFGRSEPTRPALVALARAGAVSLTWLASGEGQRDESSDPEGYVSIPCFNLTFTGPFLRGMIGVPGNRLFWQDDIVGKAAVGVKTTAVCGTEGLEFEPEIHSGDLLLFDHPRWLEPLVPSLARDWELQESGIYLVADGVDLKLRKLHKRKDNVLVIDPRGKTERTLTGAPRDFILFGPIVWRAGVVPSHKLD